MDLLTVGLASVVSHPLSTEKSIKRSAIPLESHSIVTIDDIFGMIFNKETATDIEDVAYRYHKHTESSASMVINVVNLMGIKLTIPVSPSAHIESIQEFIESVEDIPVDQQRLIFNERQLESGKTLSDYGICNESTIYLVLRLRGGGTPGRLDPSSLDARFHYDFTHITSDGSIYQRGGFVYKRPYGWNRLAVNVLGKYPDNKWLGKPGHRTHSSQGEWPVSYHGTRMRCGALIIREGYKDSCIKREKYGKGHYSSPDLSVAEAYATEFSYEGKRYKMVLQNRVNMEGTQVISLPGGDYWVTRDPANIRPYGFLFKEL